MGPPGEKHQEQLGVRMHSLQFVLLEQGFWASSCSARWARHVANIQKHTTLTINRCADIVFSVQINICNKENANLNDTALLSFWRGLIDPF